MRSNKIEAPFCCCHACRCMTKRYFTHLKAFFFVQVFVVFTVRCRSRRGRGSLVCFLSEERSARRLIIRSSPFFFPVLSASAASFLPSLCFILFWQFFLSSKSSLGYLKPPICPACAWDNSAGGSNGSPVRIPTRTHKDGRFYLSHQPPPPQWLLSSRPGVPEPLVLS